ncbi:Fanconi anemia group G protein isoform X1 [Scleropages formosus]|nr:Fanconi anemia group G protein isoform X1 [Scleropages formosus]
MYYQTSKFVKKSNQMYPRMSFGSCWDTWVKENNIFVTKWKCAERNRKGEQQDARREYYGEMCNLLRRVQGVLPVTGSVRLELAVLYNTSLFSLSLSDREETRRLVVEGLTRVLEAFGCEPPGSDLLVLWRAVLQALQSSECLSAIHQLLCVQWALWLTTGQLDMIQEVLPSHSQVTIRSPSGHLPPLIQDLVFPSEENSSLLVVISPRELKELTHICTLIAKGVRKLREGEEAEALQAFQDAALLPAPRKLLAQIHTLSGMCLAKLGRPQSSLQCYRNAMEVDFGCRSALYQSCVVYQRLGNTQAEMEALRLLHSVVVSPTSESTSNMIPLISHVDLLRSQALEGIFSVPAPVGIQHMLAQRCLHSGRITEAADHYLDLLASFQSDTKILMIADGHSTLPRIPDIYLEAAVTMLKAKRFWDSIAVCEEVLKKTVELIPGRLVLNLSIKEGMETESVAPSIPGTEDFAGRNGEAREQLKYVLWAGTALLIQGQAYSWLKENKEAITSLTRSINLLVKVHFLHKDWKYGDLGDKEAAGSDVQALQRLKGLALASRGVSFMDRGQDSVALQDFQLSLQASPGFESVQRWLVHALRKLKREDEALSFSKSMRKTTSEPEAPSYPTGILPVLLHLESYLEDRMPVDSELLKSRHVWSREVTP